MKNPSTQALINTKHINCNIKIKQHFRWRFLAINRLWAQLLLLVDSVLLPHVSLFKSHQASMQTNEISETYSVVVSLCEAWLAVASLVLSSLAQARQVVLLQVLAYVASLREALRSKLADVWPLSVVHADVVEQVPRSHEVFAAAVKLAPVDDDHFSVSGVSLVLGRVRVAFELLEVLDVGLRGLILDDVSIKQKLRRRRQP